TINPYLLVPFLALVALMQVTFAPLLAVLGVKPDLMLLVVVAWALLRGGDEGVIWAFVGGLWLDLFSGGPFGVNALALLAVSILAGWSELTVFQAYILLPVVVATLATGVYGLILLFLLRILGQPVVWSESIMRVILPSMVLNALFMPLVFWTIRKLHQLAGRDQMDW
ncbi:MAG TPA: rod shape-determining protein MreD, partial [Anaerolineae bacterium]|nr:rod shape-determining protein MreD [Anaerolineae bacterium]